MSRIRQDKHDALVELLAEVACPEPCNGRHGPDNGWHDSTCIPTAQRFVYRVLRVVDQVAPTDVPDFHAQRLTGLFTVTPEYPTTTDASRPTHP